MVRVVGLGGLLLGAALMAMTTPTVASAAAECQVAKFADIPVTMAGRRAIVTGKLEGQEARFVLDSGAFYSLIAQANAKEYGLNVRSLGPNVKLKGVGGETGLGVATAKTFTLAGQDIRNVEFAVGGGDTGYDGIIGQNILGLQDVEYDLPHGAVRLMKVTNCKDMGLAYWAGDRPFTALKIQHTDTGRTRTIGKVTVNGVELKAMFDTGATSSVLALPAAKRLGVGPDSPGTEPNGMAFGVGRNSVRSWRAKLETIDIGGETIKRPTLMVVDQSLGDGDYDMLVGIDFFLSHRVFVDNENSRMFITYEGGPIFGLSPKGAVDAEGKALDLTDKTEAPTDAAGYSQRGAVLASKGEIEAAIADFGKAIELAPTEPRYRLQRARTHLIARQPKLALADLDKAVELAPDDAEPRMDRAPLRLAKGDRDGAIADLDAAGKDLAPSSDARLRLAGVADRADLPEIALYNYDLWLRSHADDGQRATALNGRCWSRALMNKDLDVALNDCQAALRMNPRSAAYLDSRALVRLRRGELDKALADYDAALAIRPREAWSLYARSVAQRRAGKTDLADADKALALSINPKVADRAKKYGVE